MERFDWGLHESINRLWRAVVLKPCLIAPVGSFTNPSWPEWKHANIKKEARQLLDGGDDSTVVPPPPF